MKVIITGRPGIGKTTVFSKVVELLKNEGIVVGGFKCPELRKGRVRIGFDIIDILSGQHAPLARVYEPGMRNACVARVGKYCVMEDAAIIGCKAIDVALRTADVVGIDEVGPMELKLARLKNCIEKVLKNPQADVLLVLHRGLASNVDSMVRGEYKLFWVTESNRVKLPDLIVNIIVNNVKKQK